MLRALKNIIGGSLILVIGLIFFVAFLEGKFNTRYYDKEECVEALSYLEKKIKEYDNDINVRWGASRIEVDEDLQFLQNDWYSRIEFLEAVFEEAEAGFTIRINLIAAAITGSFVGAIVSVVMILIMFVTKRKKD